MNNLFYDPDSKLDVNSGGNLPHWHQDGKIQFVTFRLADSLPVNVVSDLRKKIQEFKDLHPQPWGEDIKREYWNLIGPMEERLLDKGHGSCILEKEEIREIVKNSILFKDGIDYNVIAFVIMPNHVHLVMQMLNNIKLSKILHSIKRFSALNINRLLNRRGPLWMNESFDRLIRSQRHLDHCVDYIKKNPMGFHPDRFELYINNNFT